MTEETTKGDEILVIVSDGVFEFLTNQQVIDICAECNNPLHACTRLLDESYKQWLHYELPTGDITCIVLSLKNGRANDDEVVNSLMNKRHKVERTAKVKLQRKHSMPTLR